MNFRKFCYFFFLFFALSVFAADDAERLEIAKKSLTSSDEIEQFRGYNECKTIYLRANLNKNTTLAKEALKGIIQGGEALRIDVSKYKSDLAKISVSDPIQPSSGTKGAPVVIAPKVASSVEKTVAKPVEPGNTPVNVPIASVQTNTVIENAKLLVFPKEYIKPPLESSRSSTEKFIETSPAMLFKSTSPSKSSTTDFTASKRIRLTDSKVKENTLELTFDGNVNQKNIQVLKIIEADKNRFRYIVDIDNVSLTQMKIVEQKNVSQIRIAQYDANTLRVVIEHNSAITIKPSAIASSVRIDLPTGEAKPSSISKTEPTALIQAPTLLDPPPIVTLPPIKSVTPKDRSKKIIVIDPGHGGKDSGAVGNGYMEKEIVLQISQQLREELEKLGYTVYMTRSNDVFIELKDRTKFANDKMADLFLSVHANAIPKGADANAAYGLETYFLSPGRSERAMRVAALENSEDMGEMGQYGKLSFLSVLNNEKIIASNKLAIDIQKGVLNSLRKHFPNVKDNGVREAPFWVLVGAQMPAILFESGYISNPEESARIADPKYQKWMVDGMVDGVQDYFAKNP